MNIKLDDPIFHDENAARAHLEAIHWPNGPVCPHCRVVNQATLINGKSHRAGLYQCNACRKPFSVTIGTVMERSHIALHKWVAGFHLYAASKKGFSAHQLHRMLGITYRSAWFMAHRIREAMKPTKRGRMGGKGKIVEADETYIGRKPGHAIVAGGGHKMAVVTLVERGGEARSTHIRKITGANLREAVESNLHPASSLMTDELHAYRKIGKGFAKHETVAHTKGEYVRGEAHTNTIENFFSVFKRGMKGVYQHCGEQHLKRYLVEFDFRYSNRAALEVDDTERATRAIRGAAGRRLTYQQPHN
jgi:transposase-like protein